MESHLWKPIKSRSFKNWGAILLLVWEACVLFEVFHSYHSVNQSSAVPLAFKIAVGVGVILFPVSGFLGDVVLGRYRAIKIGLLILWLSTILQSTAVVVSRIAGMEDSVTLQISNWFILLGAVGSGSFLVNSMNFGIDQLMDAPSWQISSYISWYCWCFFAPDVPNVLFLKCTYLPWSTIGTGLIALVVTIALCLDLVCNKALVKEPTSSNPLRLIYEVLKYAAKNKYPRSRNAFSYWDEKKSRIDLAKTKYGGPFTFEEIEQVKTFLRVLGITIIGGFFTGYFTVFVNGNDLMYYRFQDRNFVDRITDIASYRHCLVRQVFHQGASFLIVVGVPFLEFLVYPLLKKYWEPITTFKKFKFGLLSLLLAQLNYLALEVVGSVEAFNKNITVPCLIEASKDDLMNGKTFDLSFYWLGTPKLCCAMAYYFIFTSTVEFLCSQSPYSMKGLLMGLTYSFVALSIIVNMEIRNLYKYFTWRNNCGMLYFVVSAVITFALVIVMWIVTRWYSQKRWRDNADDDDDAVSSTQYGVHKDTSLMEATNGYK